jgi:hypothetical protein
MDVMPPGFERDDETGLIETPTGGQFTQEEIDEFTAEHYAPGSIHRYAMFDDCPPCTSERNSA